MNNTLYAHEYSNFAYYQLHQMIIGNGLKEKIQMQNLNVIGWIIISVYFMILIGLGSNLRKRASASMEDYFLTGGICMIGMYFTWYRYLPKEELAGPAGY